jgi:enterochelin esterase family protein
VFNYSRLCHDHTIEQELVKLVQMVDTTYHVNDRHYIAGLSDGARMAANTANLLPNYFSAVGLFSPVVHKQQLPVTRNLSPVTHYYVYSGKTDMFHNNAIRFNRRLDKIQAPHEYTETIGGHTWRNWRLYLSDYIIKINQ